MNFYIHIDTIYSNITEETDLYSEFMFKLFAALKCMFPNICGLQNTLKTFLAQNSIFTSNSPIRNCILRHWLHLPQISAAF